MLHWFRQVLTGAAILFSTIFLGALVQESETPANRITRADVRAAENLIGLEFSDAKRDSMLDDLNELRGQYEKIRDIALPNFIPPALQFNPLPVGFRIEKSKATFTPSRPKAVTLPEKLDDLAFLSVGELSELIRTRKVTSTQLTQMYITRLKRYDSVLKCVVTLTEELAMHQAKRADDEIAAGKYRGPLHGIPYGAKDLLAVKGYPTTWGSVPYKDQVIDRDATVIKRLNEAGAVLVAKLSLGELAWGDVWFGGMTRNPWNTDQGSSGSSAGSASATAAGLVAFAIGSETWGSIVSPSTRCGTTGLRPTFGRVSRTGAMALSWSMDKLGPICRTVEDCALVLNAIDGPDGEDQSVVNAPFNYTPIVDLKKLHIGYLKADFDSISDKSTRDNSVASLATLRMLGAKLIPIELPKRPIRPLSFVLSVEAGAAFDELVRSGKDDLLVRQVKDAWPNVFRQARFIPAVEYIQANRVRELLIQDMQRMMDSIDVYISPAFQGDNLLLTNLTGHPCVVLPNGFNEKGFPTSITFIGRLFDEGTLLAVAKRYQDATQFHTQHPVLPQ
jgi:Asp-tRNA(Asn)/Glu-tRNA(Gln) amidotransferase A subunit family amidase